MAASTDSQVQAPVIVKLGKASRKKLKKLEKGQGPLVARVQDAVREAVAALGAESNGAKILPVVCVFKEKPRKRLPFALG